VGKALTESVEVWSKPRKSEKPFRPCPFCLFLTAVGCDDGGKEKDSRQARKSADFCTGQTKVALENDQSGHD
jgi:hypothetical protein